MNNSNSISLSYRDLKKKDKHVFRLKHSLKQLKMTKSPLKLYQFYLKDLNIATIEAAIPLGSKSVK